MAHRAARMTSAIDGGSFPLHQGAQLAAPYISRSEVIQGSLIHLRVAIIQV